VRERERESEKRRDKFTHTLFLVFFSREASETFQEEASVVIWDRCYLDAWISPFLLFLRRKKKKKKSRFGEEGKEASSFPT
jgi:hypothetical protein